MRRRTRPRSGPVPPSTLDLNHRHPLLRPPTPRRHCPLFGVEKMVVVPLPKPDDVDLGLEDEYKLQLLVSAPGAA